MKRASVWIVVLSALLPMMAQQPNQGNFKILCYNVLHGFESDPAVMDKYVDWVKTVDPDIVAFQEMNKFTESSLKELAARYGHYYSAISKENGYPVAITSKYPIRDLVKVDDHMEHGYMYAKIDDINLFVVHLSSWSFFLREKEIRRILAHAALIPENEKIVIAGDFNSLCETDSLTHQDGYIDRLKRREQRDPRYKALNNGKLDYSVINTVKEAGYSDSFLMFHDAFTRAFPKHLRRVDYVWLNPVMAKYVVSSEFIYDDKDNEISDHFPLLVQFNL